MKTKTSILTALIALAGSATLMAQTNVYSLNAVGYVNTTIPAGFSIIANPLNAATNTLTQLIPNAPVNSTIYRYNGGYTSSVFGQDDNGNFVWEPDFTVTPGEGFWFKNAGAAFTNTFVGEVPQGSLTNPVPQNFSIKSSQVPQTGSLTSDLGYPATVNDVAYFYRNGGYSTCIFGQDDNGNFVWEPDARPNVGEGFWLKTTVAKNWTRNFSTSN
jgi:hypothetical protein